MIDPACVWTEAAATRLDLRTGSDQRHLIRDARVGEEIAIRHADATRGHRSGHYIGDDAYRAAREECLATVSSQIAAAHGVTPQQVADAIGRRDLRFDAAVVLLVSVLFAAAANTIVKRLLARFAPDERWPGLIAIAAVGIVVSAAGVIAGGLGASAAEMIQVGNAHLSYRAFRLPWNQHLPELFAGAVVLFSLIAMRQWRRRSSDRLPIHSAPQ
jgi:hypothetical protein